MDVREKVLKAAIEIAATHPIDEISFAQIGAVAGVHWTTVRRHLGSKQDMRLLLAERLSEGGAALADTRTRILDAATRVFASKGYAGATLDLVAADAGMTKGAVYWHFSSKSDLFVALCRRSFAQQVEMLPKSVEKILLSETPVMALSQWMLSQLEFNAQTQEQAILFFEFLTASRDPDIRDILQKRYEEMFEAISAILSDIQQRGMLTQDMDVRTVTIMFHSLLNGLIQAWLIHPDAVSFEALASGISHILWNGLCPGKS